MLKQLKLMWATHRLKSKRPITRKRAVDRLGHLADPQSKKPLLKALKDEDSRVRKSAILMLENMLIKRSHEPLFNGLKDVEPDVREAAVTVLSRIGDAQDIRPLMVLGKGKSTKDPVHRVISAVLTRRIAEWYYDELSLLLQDKDSSLRATAAYYLCNRAYPQEQLAECLRHEDPRVRKVAKDAYFYKPGRLREPWHPYQWEHSDISLYARYVIADTKYNERFSGKEADLVPLLITIVRDNAPDSYDRSDTIRALSKLDPDRAIQPLIDALATAKYSSVRWQAASMLGQIGDVCATGPLARALRVDDNFTVRRGSAVALNKLSWEPQDPYSEAIYRFALDQYDHPALKQDASVPALLDILKLLRPHDHLKQMCQAVRALGIIGRSEPVETLKELLDSLELRQKELGYAIVDALERIGNSSAVKVLEYILTRWPDQALIQIDTGGCVRAVEALGKIGNAKTISTLLKCVRWTSISPCVIRALEALFPLVSADVSDEDVISMSKLDNVMYSYYNQWGESVDVFVDCSRVRLLASKEISRRGLTHLCRFN